MPKKPMPKNHPNPSSTYGNLPTCVFDEIECAGAYLEVETGRLYRFWDNCLAPGHSPLLDIVCNEPNHYVRLSEDPAIPISKARTIAANNDYWTWF